MLRWPVNYVEAYTEIYTTFHYVYLNINLDCLCPNEPIMSQLFCQTNQIKLITQLSNQCQNAMPCSVCVCFFSIVALLMRCR